MTSDDIIRMAREAGLLGLDAEGRLERFAVLVAAAEREACAKVCDGIDRRYINQADKCAAAIRARGEQ